MEDVIKQARGLEDYMKYKLNEDMYIVEQDIEIIHNLITLCENLIEANEKKALVFCANLLKEEEK